MRRLPAWLAIAAFACAASAGDAQPIVTSAGPESVDVTVYRNPRREPSEAFDLRWLEGAGSVGITAGASAPELLVQELIARLGEHFSVDVEALQGIAENVHFRLPPQLATQAPGRTRSAPG